MSNSLSHPSLHRFERLWQLGSIRSARHRHVSLATALAAYLLGDEVDEFAGLRATSGLFALLDFYGIIPNTG